MIVRSKLLILTTIIVILFTVILQTDVTWTKDLVSNVHIYIPTQIEALAYILGPVIIYISYFLISVKRLKMQHISLEELYIVISLSLYILFSNIQFLLYGNKSVFLILFILLMGLNTLYLAIRRKIKV